MPTVAILTDGNPAIIPGKVFEVEQATGARPLGYFGGEFCRVSN